MGGGQRCNPETKRKVSAKGRGVTQRPNEKSQLKAEVWDKQTQVTPREAKQTMDGESARRQKRTKVNKHGHLAQTAKREERQGRSKGTVVSSKP